MRSCVRDYLLKTYALSDKTIIVTGSGRGLGRAMALALAKAGADIVIVSRTLSELEETTDEIRKIGRKSLLIQTDITNEAQVKAMVKETIKVFGKVDVLVNNAGIGSVVGPLDKAKLSDWSLVMKTNVTGIFLCSREVAPVMISRKKGKIINIASMSGLIINRYIKGGIYCTSKASVIGLTKALAVEWAPYNITVNAIAPGYCRTKPNEEFFKKNPEFYKKIIDMTPLRRICEPEELGGLIIYLASEASNFMTGSIVLIDGGYTLW